MSLPSLLNALYATGPTPEQVTQAQNRVRQALAAQLPEQILYAALSDSPLGPLWLATSTRGLLAVRYGDDEAAFVKDLQKRGEVHCAPAALAEVLAQVRAYLRGERTTFDLPVDLSALTDFQRAVLQAASAIPRGQVRTYAELAAQLGKPQAARAVGQALRRNPVPIVVPCHRVIGRDGGLHGYLGRSGVQTKALLLRLEGALQPETLQGALP